MAHSHRTVAHPLWIPCAALALLAGLATCGCAGRGSSASNGHPAALHVVIMKQVAFQPPSVAAAVGDTIEWRNQDLVPHTASATDSTFDSGVIVPDKSWRWVANKKGLFAYICRIHTNMHGVVTVTP